MRKFLFLLTVASLFALSGCASDTENNGPKDNQTENGNGNGNGDDNVTVTPIDLSKLDTLVGTYQIEHFSSNAGGTGGASSNWKDLDKYNNVLTDNKITAPSTGPTFADAKGNFFGKATITYNTDKKNLVVKSKLQLKDPSFKNIGITDLTPQQYNYTEYTPVPVTAVNSNDKTINKGDSEGVAKGVKGRNLTTEKSWDAAGSGLTAILGTKLNTYYFQLHTDGKIYHYMKDHSSLMAADVLVVLTKINDKAENLDPNKQFTKEESKKDIQLDGFKETPDKVTPKPTQK